MISPHTIVQAEREREEREEAMIEERLERRREAYSKYTQVREVLRHKSGERSLRPTQQKQRPKKEPRVASLQGEKTHNDSAERGDYYDPLQKRKDQLGLTERVYQRKNFQPTSTGKFMFANDLMRDKSSYAAERPILRKTKTQFEFPELKAFGKGKPERELKETKKAEAKTVRFSEYKNFTGFMKLFPFNKVREISFFKACVVLVHE